MTSRAAPEIRIYIDGAERRDIALLSVGAYAKSRPLNYATLRVTGSTDVLAGGGIIPPTGHARSSMFQKKSLLKIFKNSICEIEIDDEFGRTEHIHFGRISTVQPEFSRDGETIIATSRMDDHLFGDPIGGAFVGQRQLNFSDPIITFGYRPVFVPGYPVHFNPIVDGKAIPNSSKFFATNWVRNTAGKLEPVPSKGHMFIDPMSLNAGFLNKDRTALEEDRPRDTQFVNFWILFTAVNYLCQSLNSKETYFKNPEIVELADVFGGFFDEGISSQLRNVKIPLGTYLPKALDMLIEPHGFGWYVDITSRGTRKLRFYERGAGKPDKRLKLQAYGSPADHQFNNVEGLRGTFDVVSNTANQIALYGAAPQYEVSVLLRPAWDEEHDSATSDVTFRTDHADWAKDESIQAAWRKFAANEGGTYTGDRPWWDSTLDLSVLWPTDFVTLVKRRQILPVITEDKTGNSLGRHQGVFLEYWDPWKTQSGDWYPIDELDGGSFQIVKGEIAIVFTGVKIPARLFDIGTSATQGISRLALRLSCSIAADQRDFDLGAGSLGLLADTKTQVIDAGRNYARKLVLLDSVSPKASLGTLASSPSADDAGAAIPLGGTALESTATGWPAPYETDTRHLMTEKTKELKERFSAGTFDGSVTVEGIDRQMISMLGQPVWGITFRDFEFRVTPTTQKARYPTLVGVEMDIQTQKTRLRMETLHRA